MTHSSVTISVIMPTMNQGRYIRQALDSVLDQTYPFCELLVLDGGSVDNTLAIIADYTDHLDHFSSGPDGGQAEAINRGASLATGEILTWLNSDDYLLPGSLSCIAAAVNEHPDAVAWVGTCHDVDAEGKYLCDVPATLVDIDRLGLWTVDSCRFHQPACFFRREDFLRLGGLDASYTNVFDVEFWMRLSHLGTFRILPDVLAANRIHREAKSHRDVAFREAEHIHMLMRAGRPDLAKERLHFALNHHLDDIVPFQDRIRPTRSRYLLREMLRRLPGHFRSLFHR